MKKNSETAEEKEILKEDFPSFLPALLVKELRQGLRTRSFVIVMVALPVLLSCPFILASLRGRYGDPLLDKSGVNFAFWTIAICAILFINPLRALLSVNQEKATKSGDLLVLTNLTSFRIAFQKWISYGIQTILMTTIIFPFLVLRYFLGGVELYIDGIMLLMALLGSMLLTSVALWVSGLPALFRLGFVVGTIVFVVGVSELGDRVFEGNNFFPMDMEKTVALSLSILIMIWVSICFLLMTAKYFAPSSENLSYPLRRVVFAMSVLFSLLAIIMEVILHLGTFESIFGISFIWATGVSAAFVLTELVMPESLNSAHVEKMKEKNVLWICIPFLLPGWQSAVLFFTLMTAGFILAIMVLSGSSWFAIGVILEFSAVIWANVVFIVALFYKLMKRAGAYSLIIFVIAVGGMNATIMLIRELYGKEPLIGILPMGSLYAAADSYRGAEVYEALFVIATAILYVIASRPYWKQYRKYGQKAQGRKPSSKRKRRLIQSE